MNGLKIGTQYIVTQGDRFLFDAVYQENINNQLHIFNGGLCCSFRLTTDEVLRLTFTADPIEASLNIKQPHH